MNKPLDRLRHHVTGAIERGESVAIVERTVGNSNPVAEMVAEHRNVLAQRDELVAALEELTIALPSSDGKDWAPQFNRARAALAKVQA